MSPKAGKWKIKLSSLVSLRWKGYLPELVVHEKYERIVIWFVRVLGLIGIAISLLTIDKWYVSLAIAVLIFSITKFIENSIIQFTTILVRPTPDFDTPNSEWVSMGFAFPISKKDPPMLGPVFKTKENAIRFFELITEWNYGETVDKNNNICISLIVESYKDYSVYIYSNPETENVEEFFRFSEREQAFEKKEKKQQELVAITIFSKVFPFSQRSNMENFVRYYEWGKPYLFTVFYMNERNEQTFVNEITPILKTHLKYRKRELLPQNSIEHVHKNSELRENG